MPNKKVKKKSIPKNKSTGKKNTNLKELKEVVKGKEDKYLRLLAEFDNYKKRKNIEIDNLIKYEGFDFFKSMLSILDDIDRTLNLVWLKIKSHHFWIQKRL